MKQRLNNLRSMDWWISLSVFVLIMIGFASIYSVALSRGADFLNLKKQFIAVIIGLVIFIFLSISNYRLLRNYTILLYVVGVMMLIGVLLFGSTIRGTTGWFQLGVFSFQPVEFMKVALCVALASYFSEKSRRIIGIREVVESGLIAALPVFLTLIQPDFGSASLLFGTWFVVLLFAGLRKSHLVILLCSFMILGLVGWNTLLADYQKQRIVSFMNPTLDPLGSGYNITQAIIAVGAGGWFGRGLGFGSQSQLKFLPESQTDFIFAVIAEELGFIGIVLVLAAFALLFLRFFQRAKSTKDDFTSYLVIAISSILFIQFVVNVAMNLGLMPVTGVALPLVSYGGSSLLFTIVMIAIIQSVTIRSRQSF